MKNREYHALIALAMTLSLVVGSLSAAPSVAAKEPSTVQVAVANNEREQKNGGNTESSKSTESSEGQNETKAVKEETVYAKIDGSGTVIQVTVSDELKNVKDVHEIQDFSTLQDIENVKGDETFQKNGDELVWSGAGQEICYQGTTNKSLPVGVVISYKLDGKEISAKDLEGKSGHLTVRYQYQNHTGNAEQQYTPFLMATGLVLDEEKYTNVKITNGKLISDGDRELAIGIGIPKMQEELGMDAVDIPDYFEFEADVTDYETLEGITVATNDVFHEMEFDQFDSLSDLENAMQKLQDASNQLVNGSGELKDGIELLQSSSGPLVDGVNQLADGGNTLKDGTSQISKGSETLASGNKALSAGLSEAANKTQSELLPGVRALDDGVAGMQAQLNTGLSTLVGGVQQLNDGAAQVKQGTSGMNAILNAGTDATGGYSLQALAAKTAADAQALAGAAQTISGGAAGGAGISTDAVVYGNGGTDNAIGILQGLLGYDSVANDPDVANAVNDAINNLASDRDARYAAANDLNAEVQAQSEAAATAAGAAAAAAGSLADTAAGVAQEAGMVSAVVDSLAGVSAQVDGGVDSLQAGIAQLDQGINDSEQGLVAQVNAGVSQLRNGTSALRAGVDGENGLAAGLGKLSAGAAEASAGANALATGARELDGGAGTLVNGLNTLQSGSSELVGGIGKLNAGAVALNEGMIQFDKDGIQKLAGAFDGDLEGTLDKMSEMTDASRSYQNFSGISDGMEGQVKFIFVTE